MLRRFCQRCHEPIGTDKKVYVVRVGVLEFSQLEDLSLDVDTSKTLCGAEYEYCTTCYKEQVKEQETFFGASPMPKPKSKKRKRLKKVENKKEQSTRSKRGRPKGSKNREDVNKPMGKPIVKVNDNTSEIDKTDTSVHTLPKPPPPPKIPQ